MKEVMYKDKWNIYNSKTGKLVRTEILKHKDGGKYKIQEPFEEELKKNEEFAVLVGEWSKFTGTWNYATKGEIQARIDVAR